jgi:hypothetical protein
VEVEGNTSSPDATAGAGTDAATAKKFRVDRASDAQIKFL